MSLGVKYLKYRFRHFSFKKGPHFLKLIRGLYNKIAVAGMAEWLECQALILSLSSGLGVLSPLVRMVLCEW